MSDTTGSRAARYAILSAPAPSWPAMLNAARQRGDIAPGSEDELAVEDAIAQELKKAAEFAPPLTQPQNELLEWLLTWRGRDGAPATAPTWVMPQASAYRPTIPQTPEAAAAVKIIRPDWLRIKARKMQALSTTSARPSGPGTALLRVMAITVGGLLVVAVGAWIYKNADTVAQVTRQTIAPAPKGRYVTPADIRPVPVFPTAEAARLGTDLTPQSKRLMPGRRYRVVKSEGDVLMVEGAIDASGKKYGLWIDRHYVVDVE